MICPNCKTEIIPDKKDGICTNCNKWEYSYIVIFNDINIPVSSTYEWYPIIETNYFGLDVEME